MDQPRPDPVKLLEQWTEWERGETTPGRVMANLKTGGMRDLLEELAALRLSSRPEGGPPGGAEGTEIDADAAASWTPTV